MWLLTTRNRKELCQEVLDACIKTGVSTPGLVWMDGCDYGELKLPKGWKAVACKEHLNIGEIMRRFYAENPNLPFYGWMSDDCRPLSDGWDLELIKQAGKNYAAYPDDGWQQGKNAAGIQHLTSLMCFGGDLIRTMGFWVLPDQIQMYIDDVLESVMVPAGVMKYCPQVKAHHKHFANGERPADSTDTRTFNGVHFPSHDGEIFQKWKQSAEYADCMKRVFKMLSKSTVTFVCLKAGTAYGPEYVNILKDMVARNLPEGYPGRFVCITDDPTGLDCETIPLPNDLETWWGKLYMFKRGLFEDGERCIYIDLDTLIVGNLDEIVAYDGEFATLRDFYHPKQVGPAIICWKAGNFSAAIWDEWVASEKPRHQMGDLWWINSLDQGRFIREIDLLQDIFPGKFVSFKADCNPYPPASASIVCFHGQPKPDNCMTPWVEEVWKIGGSGMAQIESVSNTDRETVKQNILDSMKRDIRWLELKDHHEGHAVIVGGGPSLEETMPEIIWRKSIGQKIIALNGSAKYLNDHGIIPDIHVIIDARKENSRFIKESKSDSYFIASQCDKSTFDAAAQEQTTLFHLNTEGIDKIIDRKAHLISSGTTVGLAGMVIAYTQGFRKIHLYGFDSSYEENHHAYAQNENDNDSVVSVVVNDQKFTAAPWMVKQAQQFQELANHLVNDGVIITVAGKGLLPYIAHCMA